MKRQISHLQINIKATLLEAIRKIETNKLQSVFVADNSNKIIGLLVDGDIRRWLLKNLDKLPNQERIVDNFIFEKFAYVLRECFNFDNLCTLFNDEKIKIIPILNSDKTLYGFITRENFHFLLLNNIALKPSLKIPKDSKHDLSIHSRPWGFYKSLLLTNNVQSKIITLFPKQMISLQKHTKREEHWVVVYGKGNIVLENSIVKAYTGKYVFIPKGCKHRIINTSAKQNLIFCEVQLGNYFGEDDIIRYEDKYNRR